ncbi:tyrosine--tRNA ligase [Patescibacteria group bacterium]|nr:tyrosine--tRNA ligase [Patescibacteria group bacterium]
MKIETPTEKQLNHLLDYNIASLYPSREFAVEALKGGKQISIYLGVDPSSSNIHLGNAVVLRKLREFQNLGHKIIFLIGDFTGLIGDPTDKTAVRKQLTPEEVKKNAKTYKEQISLLLDFDGDNPAEIKFNSKWLSKLNFEDLIGLAANFTVQQMLERDMFQERIKNEKPIYLHEFFYPLMQAYDCVEMNVDAEIGGTDQTFNMLVGRTLMKSVLDKEKLVFTCPLLVGSDGHKMSKSLNNTIDVFDTPSDMYGKLMAVKDELIIEYLRMCTDYGAEEIENFREQIEEGENPMEIKKVLAFTVTKFYHGENKAQTAEKEFERVVQKGDTPTEIAEVRIDETEMNIVDLLVRIGLANSKAEAKRLVNQDAVEIDGSRERETAALVKITNGMIVKAGKRKFARVIVDGK